MKVEVTISFKIDVGDWFLYKPDEWTDRERLRQIQGELTEREILFKNLPNKYEVRVNGKKYFRNKLGKK